MLINKKQIPGLIFSLALVGLTITAWLNQTAIYDFIRLYRYQPPADIVKLADETTMLPSTRRLFYVYHPDIENKDAFNQHCTDSEKTIVLGCYVPRRGIYIYNVTDKRLDGVTEVTAAHETLHAAYDRLSSGERKHIDELTAQVFAGLQDKRIKDTIADYRAKDPSVVPNELHSILGTEVRNLPPELENYYKRYFSDRAKIVSYSEQYEQEFTAREAQRQAYDEQLKSLKTQIDSLSASLTGREQQISQDYQRLTALRSAGNTPAYNAGVPTYNQEVNTYNSDVKKVQALIKQYNDIVAKRNALVIEEGRLIQAIDSRPTTIQSQ